MDLSTLTLAQARRDLDAKKYSALELTEAYLAAIREKDADLHAYLEVWSESAREEARRADEMIAARKSMPLTGIPLARRQSQVADKYSASRLQGRTGIDGDG